MWLPDRPMRRHHYIYMRDRYATPLWEEIRERFVARSCQQAVEDLGVCRPDGPGSLTHPHPDRVLVADGKVNSSVTRAKRGDRHPVDTTTGESKLKRADPTSELHVTGSGEPAYGNKFVLVACRTTDVHGRMILDLEWSQKQGGEVTTMLGCIGRVAPHLPGAQALLYDGLPRGAAIQELLHVHGILPIIPVNAASGGRKAHKPRTEKLVAIERRVIPNGKTVDLDALAGQLGLVDHDEAGEPHFTPLDRVKIEKRRNADRTWRWYGNYRLPAALGGGTIRVRHDLTDEDRRRRFNRTENLRPIPPADADFKRLYGRRNDIESINRAVNDSMWLDRAHSFGGERQRIELLGFALVTNSVALFRARRRSGDPPAAAAA